MIDKDKALPQTLFPFIWHFLREYRFIASVYLLLAIVSGLWGPFNTLLIKHVIDLLPSVPSNHVSPLIAPLSLIVVNFLVIDNCTWRGIAYIRAKHVPVINTRIIGGLLNHCLEKSHQFYQEHLSGKIAKQIINLEEGVDNLISNITPVILRGISLVLTAFLTAYFANPLFCLILVLWFLTFMGVSITMSKKLISLSDAQAYTESVVVGELVDSLTNHSNVSLFSRKSYENVRMGPFFKKQQKAYTATNLYSLVMVAIQGILIALMTALSAFCLVYLYSKNVVTIGDFTLILGLAVETGNTVWYAMDQVDEYNKSVGRCRQSLVALMPPPEIQDDPDATLLHCSRGQITFNNVKFHYKSTAPLFQNKSIVIPAGQKVGLVGYSGSGKSTFVNLILRFYEVSEGQILIDGQNIRHVTQNSLRANIAMIPQDPTLFNRNLLENIRYGRIDATDEAVVEAAKKAHAHEFITKLPQGYAALVGERGAKLSGGQRQRIAIARAILKNAPILILDEATSQLDSATESMIQESLWQLMEGKTTIIIAHRLSTLLHMDRILVFDKGQIVEEGSHAELLNKKKLYKKLWDTQVGGFLSDEKREE